MMSAKLVKKPAYGKGAKDLQRYMEWIRGPIHAFRLARCSCRLTEFRLQLATGKYRGLVYRTCVACGRGRVIGGQYAMDVYPDVEIDELMDQFWQRIKSTNWACEDCGKGETNVGVGFTLSRGGKLIDFMRVGQRCVACGRLGSCSGWEESNGTWMFDEI